MNSISKICSTIFVFGLVLSLFVVSIDAQDHDIGEDWPHEDIKSGTSVRQVDFEKTNVANQSGSKFGNTSTAEMSQEALSHEFSESADDAKEADAFLAGAGTSAGFMSDIGTSLGGIDITRMLGALALVLGGYFGFVWIVRKANPGGTYGLPQEVVEVLGATPFGPKKQLQVVRLGSKLLLLVNGAEGTQPIGEITDPNEVEYLASLCSGKNSGNSAIAVRKASANAMTAANAAAAATATANSNPTSANLKQILHQLQTATGAAQNGAVFDA